VAIKSLFLEASWNLVGQQNIGYAAAVSPALQRFYHDRPEDLAEARLRALRFFNTNPTFSGLVIGAALKLEENLAQGLIPERQASLIVSSLASALAAQGDLLFWQAWLPFCALLGFGLTWLSLATGSVTWAPLLIPILFCALAWPVRLGGIFYGYRLGPLVHQVVKRFYVSQIAQWVKRLTVFLTGFLTIFALKTFSSANLAKELAAVAVVTLILFITLGQRLWPGLGSKAFYLLIVLGLALTTLVI
jgi:PTS system mannose-specific IID component